MFSNQTRSGRVSKGMGVSVAEENVRVSVSVAGSLPFKIVEQQGMNQLYQYLNLSLLLNRVSEILSVLLKLLKSSRKLLGCLNCSMVWFLPSTL